jgi:hypothetical protein
LALESIDLPERNSADFGISPIFASGTIQQVNKERTHSYGVSLGYSNLELMQKILNFNTDFEKAPKVLAVMEILELKQKAAVL